MAIHHSRGIGIDSLSLYRFNSCDSYHTEIVVSYEYDQQNAEIQVSLVAAAALVIASGTVSRDQSRDFSLSRWKLRFPSSKLNIAWPKAKTNVTDNMRTILFVIVCSLGLDPDKFLIDNTRP